MKKIQSALLTAMLSAAFVCAPSLSSAQGTAPAVSADKAEQIATQRCNGGVIVKNHYEVKREGRSQYEIDVKNNKTSCKLKVDAATGNVLSYAKKNDRPQRATGLQTAVSGEKAGKIALDKAGGGTIIKQELKIKHKKDRDTPPIYDVHVVNKGMKYEYKINANTGEVVAMKEENVRK